MATHRSPKISDLFALDHQLQEDRDQPRDFIARRDREIGKGLIPYQRKPVRQILSWLAEAKSERSAVHGNRVDHGVLITGFVLLIAGLLVGWGTAAAVFYYDGSHPVNVVHVLAVFVGLQLLLLVFLMVALCPGRWMSWLPGFGSLQRVLRLFSPGRLQWAISRLMPQAQRQTFSKFMGRSKAHQRVYGDVQKWQIMRWSQSFALAFNVGAILCCVYLVVFSDLAFSWSTTLQTEPVQFHRVTQFLSAPWASWIPEAEPSQDLVTATRYFRLKSGTESQNGHMASNDPAVLGGWWPFLAASLIFYGLLPRFLTWCLVTWRLSRALNFTLQRIPGAPDLLDRLNRPFVETRASDPEKRPKHDKGPTHAPPENIPLAETIPIAIAWADLPFSRGKIERFLRLHLNISFQAMISAGGSRSLDQDAQTIQAVSKKKPTATMILIKAWEAPTLELADFVEDLRASLGDGVSIHVVPIGLDADQDPTLPKTSDCAQWRSLLTPLGDPWLRIIEYEKDLPS